MKNNSKLFRKNTFDIPRCSNVYSEFVEDLCDALDVNSSRPKHSFNRTSNQYREVPQILGTRLRKAVEKAQQTIYMLFYEMRDKLDISHLKKTLKSQSLTELVNICEIIRVEDYQDVWDIAVKAISSLFKLKSLLILQARQNLEYYQLIVKLQQQIEQLLYPFLLVKEFHKQKQSSVDDLTLIQTIENDMTKNTFKCVVKGYLEEEAAKLGQEICRICEHSIELEEMDEHVKQCQKIYETRQAIRNAQKQIVTGYSCLKNSTNTDASTQKILELLQPFITEHGLETVLLQQSHKKLDSFLDESLLENSTAEKIRINIRKLLEGKRQSQQSGSGPSQPSQENVVYSIVDLINTSQIENSLISKMAIKYAEQDPQEKESSDNSTSKTNLSMKHLPLKKKSSRIMMSNIIQNKNQIPSQQSSKSISQRRIHFKDFKVIKPLGKGAFGRVYLVQRRLTRDLYAMKVVEMGNTANKDLFHDLATEHQIFKKIGGQHLVKAAFSFSQGSVHFFFLQFMKGGDFGQLLQEQVYLEQPIARQYIAQIVLAIEHLHSFGIVHRDLKPSNLVLDEQGHIKLTDFGLSLNDNHQSENGSCRVVGTPDYTAPQILTTKNPSNKSIDWWSLGVMVYEMLIGVRPFSGQTVQEIHSNILYGKLQWPPIGYESGMLSPESKDLIQGLLQPEREKRLGNRDANQIKEHRFFKGIDWTTVKHAKIKLQKQSKVEEKWEQNIDLSKQIEKLIKDNNSSAQNTPNRLDDLVRFDLLSQETIKSAQKVRRKNLRRLSQISDLTRSFERHFA